jgi:hypothetical protein
MRKKLVVVKRRTSKRVEDMERLPRVVGNSPMFIQNGEETVGLGRLSWFAEGMNDKNISI